ncbi:hypothetical protein K0651_13120 [Ornithinimicrobium sp. Arc0846-15]|nr:hypothetical protein [Ornithinimicrobium laminariae]
MAADRSIDRRRPRGAAKGFVPIYAKVDPELKAQLDRSAEECGVSLAEFMQAFINAQLDLGPDGVPTWWDQPVPGQEELNLRAS